MPDENNDVNIAAQQASDIRRDSRVFLTQWLDQFWVALSDCYWALPGNIQKRNSFRKDLEKKIWESIRVFDSESPAQLCSIIYPLTTKRLRERFVSEREFADAFLPNFKSVYLNADPTSLVVTQKKAEELSIVFGEPSMVRTIQNTANRERVRAGYSEDILAELFDRLWNKIDKYSFEEGIDFSVWCRVVARNLIGDLRRRDQRLGGVGSPDPDDHDPIAWGQLPRMSLGLNQRPLFLKVIGEFYRIGL